MQFGNTKFDVRDWTEEQKVQFQEKCFELGYGWLHTGKEVYDTPFSFLFISGNKDFTCSEENDLEYFKHNYRAEKTWEDMFPTPKLDVSKEIATLVFEALDKMEEEVIQEEEENGFEGLEYHPPNLIDKYYVVPLDCVSDEQLTFLEDNLDLHPSYKLSDNEVPVGLASLTGEGDWFFCTRVDTLDTRITFNDLFKYEEV